MRSVLDNLLAVNSIDPKEDTGGSALTGNAVDTLGYGSAVLHVRTGAASGTPTSASTVIKLQECATSGGSYTDALDRTGTVIGKTIDSKAAAADTQLRIEGLGQNRLRFFKIVVTTTFVGGTTPKVATCGTILLGHPTVKPVQASTNT